MRRVLLIAFRTVMVAGFVLGLFWLIRFESVWTVLTGLILAIATVPLGYWMGRKIEYPDEESGDSFVAIFKWTSRVIIPLVLFLLFLSTTQYLAGAAGELTFWLFAIVMAPFALTLADLIRGELRWDPVEVAHTYTRALVGLFGTLALMFGVIAVGAVSIVGVISLLVSLGDLAIYGLNPAHSWTTPVICTLNDFKGPHCGAWLLTWHISSLTVLFVFVNYGDELFNKAADFVNSFR